MPPGQRASRVALNAVLIVRSWNTCVLNCVDIKLRSAIELSGRKELLQEYADGSVDEEGEDSADLSDKNGLTIGV